MSGLDPERVSEHLVRWLQAEVEAAGARGLVFGLSGGIDSAVVARLAWRAFRDTHLALILPIQSDNEDIVDARLVVQEFHLNAKELVLDGVYDVFAPCLGTTPDPGPQPDLALANLKARLRMCTLYYFANRFRYLVAGTGNRSELTLGYFTKYGDGGVDLLPLGHMVKSEVRAMAEHLGVPRSIIDKPPAAGIWRGLTDEGELGFTYGQLEDYLLGGVGDDAVKQKVDQRRRRNAHKLRTPKMPPPHPLG